jgi:uncharacterized membrane protein
MQALYSSSILILIQLLEAIGITVIVGGFVVATRDYVTGLRQRSAHEAYLDYRRRSVRGLILGLEFLVAADIIKTVTVDYSLNSVLILGLVILIRSVLVFALHIEVEGKVPWASGGESSGP